jgi:Mrp family chromosome partitioning ATPase/uncharacterized protein involved in exopolysaccharide biosynthesis
VNQSNEPTVFGAIWHYRWLALAILVVFAVAGLLYTTQQSPQFYASATLVIEDPRSSSLFQSLSGVSPQRYITDQVAVISSTTVADRAAEIAQSTDPSLTADAILEGEYVQSDTTSNAVVVGFFAANSDTAIAGANAIVTAYQEVRRGQSLENAQSALDQLDSAIASIDDQLASIEEQLNELRSPVSGNTDLDAQFDSARGLFSSLLAKQRAGTITEEETTELASLVTQFQTMQVISSISSQQPEVTALVREQASAIDRRSTLSERRDEIAVDAELASGGVSLPSPAIAAAETGGSAGRDLAVALVLGGLAAAGIPYLLALRRQGFDQRFQPEQILGARLLAEVPNFRDENIDSAVPVRDARSSAAAEAFRFGITGLELQLAGRGGTTDSSDESKQPPKTVIVISATVGDGKTTVCGNLAYAAAGRGKKVLAIDADFGDQQLTALAGFDPKLKPGLTDFIENGTKFPSVVQRVEVGKGVHFDLLSRGTAKIDAPNFFRSTTTKAFFERIGNAYDLVLVDCPPILNVAYTSVLARYADVAVVVVPHGGSPSVTEDVRGRLELIDVPIAGYVYNRAPLRSEMTRSEGSMRDILGSAAT